MPGRDDPVRAAWEVGHFPDASYFENNEAALARSAIGLDNDLTNPLHLALIASAIANDGTMYAPRLVTEVRDTTTGRYDQDVRARRVQPPADRRLRPAATADDGERGGKRHRYGCTDRRDGRGRQDRDPTNGENTPPNAWFTSFAPAGSGETARIAVAVIVLDGGDLGNEATGGQVAAPIAKQVMEAYLGR